MTDILPKEYFACLDYRVRCNALVCEHACRLVLWSLHFAWEYAPPVAKVRGAKRCCSCTGLVKFSEKADIPTLLLSRLPRYKARVYHAFER